MSNNNDVLQGEDFSHTVSAQYNSQASADQAVQRLIQSAQLAPHQIKVVQPHDPHMGRKVEPDDKGIARTLVNVAHSIGTRRFSPRLITGYCAGAFWSAGDPLKPTHDLYCTGFYLSHFWFNHCRRCVIKT